LYQNAEDLLKTDAKVLNLRILSKAEELEELVAKTGKKVASELREIMRWTGDRKTPTCVHQANTLEKNVQELLTKATKKRKIDSKDAEETKRLLTAKIRQAMGNRNENLAIQVIKLA
jgi:hypothetical protein